MGSVVEIGGIAGWAALAGPMLLLAAALMMALFWPHRADATLHESGWREPIPPPAPIPAATPVSATEPGFGPGASQSGAEPRLPLMEPSPEPLNETLPTDAHRNVTLTTAAKDTAIEPSTRAITPSTLRETRSESTEAAAARALLDEALSERAAGNKAAAAECLRGAILLATKAGDRTLHAACRLELGDIVQAEGDLQTACEHWQMARSLFEDEQRTSESAKCEKRMLKNRCPTDWVLNDF